jgi:4-aminobutyrate aminotransferase/(S)-3-amino-2-methylpropionate transaminase
MTSNADLLKRRRQAVPRGVATATDIFPARAENGEVWDVEGRRYIDFVGGIAVLAVGHRHPRVMAAVQEQLERYTHTAFQVMAYEPYVALAERLNAMSPTAHPAKTFLATTGAEAVENAVKIARAATGRSGVIAFTGGFHGRTLYATALTGRVHPYKHQFGALPAEVYHLPFPARSAGSSPEESLAALQLLTSADIAPERIAAIIVEPVQGEGGFHIAPAEFLRAVRRFCDDHGVLLIADEIQTGFGRTGRMFAVEASGVKPDLVTVAKSLAGGFPLSGVIGRASVMDCVEPGGLGGTYAGSPVSCAAALATIEVIEEQRLPERAGRIGMRLADWMEQASRRNDLAPIANARGMGAMAAFDVVDADGRARGTLAKEVVRRAADQGLILLTCGSHGQSIRFLMPLTISDDLLEEGLAVLDSALRDVGTLRAGAA